MAETSQTVVYDSVNTTTRNKQPGKLASMLTSHKKRGRLAGNKKAAMDKFSKMMQRFHARKTKG